MKLKNLAATLIFLLFAGLAEAAVKYVDNICTSGQTSYNPIARSCVGGSATVYATINAGIAATASGDTLYIRGGTYPQSMAWPANGSPGAPTTIARYQNETVIFTPPSGERLTMGGTNPTWITFDGLIVDGTASGTGFVDGLSVCCHYVSNVVFQNGEIRNFGGNGVEAKAESMTIRNTKIHNNGSNTTAGPGHGLYISCHSGCVFEDNEVYNNDHYGFHVYDSEFGGTAVQGNIIRGNRVYGNGKSSVGLNTTGFGILLSSGANNVAYNNVIYDNGVAGQAGGGINVAYACDNCKVYNNTTYGNANYGMGTYDSASNTIFRNNISWGNALGSMSDAGSGTIQDHNLCNSGCTGTGSINGSDPLFVNSATRDFHLQAKSPAIDVGTTNIAPFINIPACSGSTTTNCYNGTAPDLGALETGVPTAGGGPPTLTANLTNVAPGGTIQVTVNEDNVNQRTELTGDSVHILPSSNYDQNPIDYLFMNGTKTAPAAPISNAVLTFTAPSTVGSYDFVFYPQGATQANQFLAATTFNVVAPGIVMKFNVSSLKIGPSVTWKIGTP